MFLPIAIIYSLFIYLLFRYASRYYTIYNTESCIYNNIHRINECFFKTRRVTCLRKSNKRYMRRRNYKHFILLLKEYNYTITNKAISRNCTYLVIIITSPDMFFERYIFRKIYKIYKYITYLFVMGKSKSKIINRRILKEIYTYNDILLFDFTACYYSLTLQTYNILIWANKLNIHFDWLIKHDSDTFFNFPELYDIQSYVKDEKLNYIWGYILKYFPSGMGYIIPHSSIKKLIDASIDDQHHDYYGFAEDIYIGKLAKKANISLFDFKYINKSIGEGNCYIKKINNFIMIHRLMPIEIFFLHFTYTKTLNQ